MNADPQTIVFGETPLSIESIIAIAGEHRPVQLSDQPVFVQRIEQGRQQLDRHLAEDVVVYGVTTGYGDSVSRSVAAGLLDELPLHLSRFHGCGLGDPLSVEHARAVMAVRLASLCSGYSGVSRALLQQLVEFLNHDIVPVIPAEGSVGASGDLTPLSYIAATLAGEREVIYRGTRMPSRQALQQAGLQAFEPGIKEALAIMNGTAVMTALTCCAWRRAEYMAHLAARISALAVIGLQGNPGHFDARLATAKPHPGQTDIAARMHRDLAGLGADYQPARLQDRYSIRCAPHVIGVLADMLPVFRQTLETELNSANDNPLIDPDSGDVLHGGHFYGGHVAFVADSMKNLVANIADLLDRQLALLVDPRFNHGLPANLSGAPPARASINHGLKAVQIGASAWAAEALKNTMPASVFSRSTECHNQDKVSMGTIAARDCLRVLELSEQVAAAQLIAVHQAIQLRLQQGQLARQQLTGDVQTFIDALSETVPFIDEDQPLEDVLRTLVQRIQSRQWSLD
ncbi:histidine ammonia-lyase [Methylohalomonas lacus]|uniref:tyrosine ammonia-lyase n=1 Tax=Methylohalomonas lacus TaxID=398773 RepID=A0AAE3HHF3_9GAMM|nr:aromatic amino acid ammonia-lyase [Methylohalomonas lacus]MCS3902361.1 histidine ammonia-lyase [Methylohalomonas lacus]